VQNGTVQFQLSPVSSNASTLVWCSAMGADAGLPLGCDGLMWTFTLSADGNSLTMEVVLSSPVKHLHIVMSRVPGSENLQVKDAPPPHDCDFGPLPPNVAAKPATSKSRKCPYKSALSPAAIPRISAPSYPFCYLLNPVNQFELAWSTDIDSNPLDPQISFSYVR
jgi:hypothetical protein